MNEPLEDLERRLNVQTQQHLLNELRRLKDRQHHYDQALVVLSIAIVGCIIAIALDEYKLSKVEQYAKSVGRPRPVVLRLPVDQVQEADET